MVIATNILGLGIDMPNIWAIIHIDSPQNMRDFGQESGCGGWDRQISYLIIIVLLEFEYLDMQVKQFI